MNSTLAGDAHDLRSFYLALDTVRREAFAQTAGTTRRYLECHVIYARKKPKAAFMSALWEACEAYQAPFTRADLLKFFYPDVRA